MWDYQNKLWSMGINFDFTKNGSINYKNWKLEGVSLFKLLAKGHIYRELHEQAQSCKEYRLCHSPSKRELLGNLGVLQGRSS